MKVFISWSGEESGAVAQVLRQQLPCIIQAVKPFVSSEDINKGAAWFQHIGAELEKSDFGILCLTNTNQDSKWVQFEAGALAGRFSKARMAPLLINVTPSSIKPPLSQFQLTDINNKDDFLKLLLSINVCLGENALPQETLQEVFNNWWNPFNQKVKSAIQKVSKKEVKSPPRTEREILEEILSLTRSIALKIPNAWETAQPALNGLVTPGLPLSGVPIQRATKTLSELLSEMGVLNSGVGQTLGQALSVPGISAGLSPSIGKLSEDK